MISSEKSNIAHQSILKEVHEVAFDETDSELPQSVTPIAETNPKSTGSTPKIDEQRKELEDFLRLPSTEGYLRCLGKVRWCSNKLSNKGSEAVGPSTVLLKSAYTDLISPCGEVVEIIQATKNFAEAGLQALQNQSDDTSVMLENNTLIQHDPARRPSTLTRGQIKYMIHLGPCQPKLSIYPRNPNLLKKGKQSSFSQAWYDDYPYLEYSVLEDKPYCLVCSIFGQGGYMKGKAEKVWIEGTDDWAKMKGSRGKNKPGKLQTHFSCDAHTAALREFAVFVQEAGHIDTLLSKPQQKSVIDNESKREKNREVIEMLIEVVKTLTRNGIALRGDNLDEDGNFQQIVYLLSRHNPAMKAWLDDCSSRTREKIIGP